MKDVREKSMWWGWGGVVKCVGGICLSHHLVYYNLVSRFAVCFGQCSFSQRTCYLFMADMKFLVGR